MTGRSHQIRVHLAAGGTPIAGDALYGGEAAARRAERLQLHATSLQLRLAPEEAARRLLVAPPPADFAAGLGGGGPSAETAQRLGLHHGV